MFKLTADANFKTIFRNKKVALKFIKLVIPELSKSKEDILKGYSVIGEELEEDHPMTEEDAQRYISEEIEYLPDSRRDEKNKEIIHDVLFSYRSDVIPTSNSTITVDCEMENWEQSYPIAARGTYYASKLHAQTIEKGGSYNDSNKVYSIWLLNYRNWKDEIAIRSIYQAMTYTDCQEVELRGENKTLKGYDRKSDGLEVIYIELPKVDKSNMGAELKNMLLSIRDGDDIMKTIRRICGLKQKEAETMQDNMQTINVKVNPYIEMGKQEGRLEGRREGRLEGRLEGKLEGRREGRLEGRQEGRREGIIKVAKAMLEEGMPIDLISRITKLPEDVIKSLPE